ncbi:unnamed protein product, partial [Prorocentrum cordatum]
MDSNSDIEPDQLDDGGADASAAEEDPKIAASEAKAEGDGSGQNKRLKIVDDHGKAKKGFKGGKKWCPPCGKYESVEVFPPGSGQCGPGRQIMQNLKNAAKSQGKEKWWEEACADPKKLVRVCNNYKARCPPPPPGKKREGFSIATYLEEIRQEQSVIYDGISEMMSLPHFVSWMGKPKNGSMDPQEAAAKWQKLYNTPGAITDKLGHVEKHPERVAVKKSDIITNRDAYINAQTLQLKGDRYATAAQPRGSGSQEDIDKMAFSLREGPKATVTANEGRAALAKRLVNAKSAAIIGGGDGAFSESGRAAVEIGDVGELDSDSEEAAEQGDEEEEEGAEGAGGKRKKGEAGAGGGTPKKQKGSAPKPWFDRDAQVSAALRSHENWQKGAKADLEKGIESARDVLESVSADVEDNVKNEKKLCKNRLYALRLVLGDGASTPEDWDLFDSKPPAMKREGEEAEAEAAPAEVPAAEPGSAGPEAAPPASEAGPAAAVAKTGTGITKQRWRRKDPAAAAGAGEEAHAAPAGAKLFEDLGKAPPGDPFKAGDHDQARGGDEASTVAQFYMQTGGDASRALKRYIASFSSSSAKPELGSAPPCRSYRSLIVVSEFDQYTAKIEQAESKEALVAISTSMKPFKAAYVDLLAMAKAAVTRLKNAIDDAKKDTQKDKASDAQVAAAGGRKRGRPKKQAKPEATLMVDNWAQACDSMKSVAAGDQITPEDMKLPLIVRIGVGPEIQKFVPEDDLSKFELKFKTDPSRDEPGRCQKKIKPEGVEAFSSKIGAIFPGLLADSKTTEAVKAHLTTTLFAVAKGRTTCSAEAGHLAVVRFGIKALGMCISGAPGALEGTREIICAPTAAIMEYSGIESKGPATLKEAYHWLKNATVEATKNYKTQKASNKLFGATVGPGDIAYLPAGWTYFEKIMGADFIGVRRALLAPADISALDGLNKLLITKSAANATLQGALDCLVMLARFSPVAALSTG